MNAEPNNSIDRIGLCAVNEGYQVKAKSSPKTTTMIAGRTRRWRTNTAAKIPLLAALIFLLGAAPGLTQVRTRTVPLGDLNELKARNVKIETVTYKGRRALRVTDAAPDVGDGERLVFLNRAE